MPSRQLPADHPNKLRNIIFNSGNINLYNLQDQANGNILEINNP